MPGVIPVCYPLMNVDLKTVANHTLIAPLARKFLLDYVDFVPVTFTAITGSPQFVLGSNASTYNNIVGADTAPSLNDGQGVGRVHRIVRDEYAAYADLATSGLVLRIPLAAVGTAFTGHFFIVGSLHP